ncbi:MAG: aminoacyl-tRNA hydrolase [Patescibacteria group bacterium]|nr:aminoacyl-tRNA hydrolase [Patescibacteria group bacterium]
MILLIGLGNPGAKYKNTPHNLGFDALDRLCPDFKLNKKFKSQIAKGIFLGREMLLAKPQTFMNLSGASVSAIANYYKIKPKDIWVFQDDIDLPLGKIRISRNASAAGHRGVESIIDALGTKDFVRFRLGAKTPASEKIPSEDFVLKKFSKADRIRADKMVGLAIEAGEAAAQSGPPAAMNKYN